MNSSDCFSRPALPINLPSHRWKVLAAGVLANAAFSTAFSGIPMTAVVMRSSYQLDTSTLGLMLGLMGLGIALSELPWGLLTDRWGDRPVLLTGLIGTALALAAMAIWATPEAGNVPGLQWLAGGLVLVGLLGGSLNGASGRAVMTWFADGERGLAMSIRQTAVPLGGAIGALLLPALALHGGFLAVFAVLASLCLLSALLVVAWVHEPPHTAQHAQRQLATGPSPLRDVRAWRSVAGIGMLCAPQFAVLSFGTVFLHDFAQAELARVSAVMAFVQCAAMAMRVWSGRWTDRHRNRQSYLSACSWLSMLLFAALATACLLAPGPLLLLFLTASAGICVSAWHGVAYTELASLAGAGRAGTALGMANTSVFIVCFAVPMLIPHLLSLQGWVLVWLACALCAVFARPLLVASQQSAARVRE
ncbi:MFS transporter [Comamonas testosteroni]|uniref:MFS transporter n=1 Tax=Comamonas testosteroni TaxID=285 RepID=UPI0026EE751C|nr:MFS transporter [Comamonas testosteroni]WQD42056.1 MFS transporter [Comamonas testosteroni]